MNNLYESPKNGSDARVYDCEGGVTERMVMGVLRTKKWASYLAYLNYFFFGMTLVFTLVSMIYAVYVYFFTWAPFIRDFEDVESVNIMPYVFAAVFTWGLMVISSVAFFKSGKAMRQYADVCDDLEEKATPDFVSQCFRLFARYATYSALLSSVSLFMVLVSLAVARMVG